MKRAAHVATGAWTLAMLSWGSVLAFGQGPGEGATPGSPLAGTEWRLVEIQSMDDAIGSVRPDEPSRYTLRLNADGTANLRLDCNRANGTWSAGPAPVDRAATSSSARSRRRAPSARHPAWTSGWRRRRASSGPTLLKDGRLYLSLMADGGIIAWEPHSRDVPFLTTPDPALEAAILAASPSYTRELVDVEGASGRGRYVYGRVDLDGDGKQELLVYLLGPAFCGTGGCNLLLFTRGRDGYSLVNDFPISRLPVIVSADKTGGSERPLPARIRRRRESLVRPAHVRRQAVRREGAPSGGRGAGLSQRFDQCDDRTTSNTGQIRTRPRSMPSRDRSLVAGHPAGLNAAARKRP